MLAILQLRRLMGYAITAALWLLPSLWPGRYAGRELGAMLEKDIPAFLVELGKTVSGAQLDFAAWNDAGPDGLERVAESYLA